MSTQRKAAIAMANARLISGLRAERNRLFTMLQQMREAVIFAGADGNIVLINESARVTLGLDDRDPVGSPVLDFFDRHLKPVAAAD